MSADAIIPESVAPAGAPGANEALAPASPSERVFAIDVLRGVAVFGILVVNMAYFSGPMEWATNPARWPAAIDRVAAFLIRWLAEGKFYLLFSLLFGLGMFIQMGRAEARAARFVPLHLRRMGVLLAIGAAHVVVLWAGDILHCYALLGLVLLLFRRVSDRWLARWIVTLIVLPLAVLTGLAGLTEAAGTDPETRAKIENAQRREQQKLAELAALSLDAYASRSFEKIIRARIAEWSYGAEFLAWMSPTILGIFLLGVLVGRTGMLRDTDRHLRLLRLLARVGIPVGLVLNLGYAALASALDEFRLSWSAIGALALHVGGGPLLCFGYVAALSLTLRQAVWRVRLAPLAAVGRTALSNYLFQSLVCTTIFYGYGLGLYGRVGPAAGFLLTVAIFAGQTALSVLWARRFRFGPAEWLWRSLAYGRLQPLRPASA